ncbi:response regulator transcription factor [Aestuariispira insulae]|uniref:LuxR family two component transcriptional regulator n=1 Tax=Aestuariispira insulae TaxID=1461337 RepID=A0A3D9HS99_9PROT|nr:response regulator transcription factor [Aestuariispira insulae]RED52211.1 LuxR family two component transcriptional regulator [Aestuariispira insulae]
MGNPADKPIRVLLADDHPLVLDGIRACLEINEDIEVVATAGTGREALERAAESQPDIVLMDINMPELNGLDATEVFRERYPAIKLLMLSMHDNREYITSALNSGARGFVLKDVPSQELVTAIRSVHQGGTYFSSGVSDILLNSMDSDNANPLTTREQTILILLAQGKSNKHVARELDISVRTAETHRRNIKRKLKISTTAGLTKYAIECGLV